MDLGPPVLDRSDAVLPLNDIVEKLTDKMLRVRTVGLEALQRRLASEEFGGDEELKVLLQHVETWCGTESKWEARQSGVHVIHALVSGTQVSEGQCDRLADLAVSLLEDPEFRVRMAVAEALGALTKRRGVSVFLAVRDRLYKSIDDNFTRDAKESDGQDQEEEEQEEGVDNASSQQQQQQQQSVNTERVPWVLPKGKHDTEGWKSLETSFKALQCIIAAAGVAFEPFLDESFFEMIKRGAAHQNRFVREISYFTCCTVSEIEHSQDMSIKTFLADIIAVGLGDNWSQVRYASSAAVRAFLKNIDQPTRELFYDRLLPPMCLNRYYVAKGVQLYSQATWGQFFGPDVPEESGGKVMVLRHIAKVVDFYISQAEADNHAVREAACYCIAELATKVEHGPVMPYVPRLLEALLLCFRDESWPVRDAACQACGDFVSGFPNESKGSFEELFHLWFDHISDNIASVREGSAIALGKVLKTFKSIHEQKSSSSSSSSSSEVKEPILTKVLKFLDDNILKAKVQANESKQFGGLENTTVFGVAAKKRRDNDEELHSNQVMYSCGSLAPKLKPARKNKRGGGCMDHSFRRDPEPWETSEGCVQLVWQLSYVYPAHALAYVPKLTELSLMRHYSHHFNVVTAVWTRMRDIASNSDKKLFKRHFQDMLEGLFYALNCENRLAQNAAGAALNFFARYLGPSILHGRIESHAEGADWLDDIRRSEFVARDIFATVNQ